MDELVFIIFGVLSVLLVIGVIITLVGEQEGRQTAIELEQSLTELQAFCDNICLQPEETLKKTEITLTRDAVLQELDDRICIGDDCRRCRCPVTIEKVNLTNAPFATREYACLFHRTQEEVIINCSG